MEKSIAIFVATASLLASHFALADGSGRYVMLDSEWSMDQPISRWAAQEGRTPKWEAWDYIDVGIPSALNRKARLADAANIGDATGRLLKQAPDEVRLFACVYAQGPVAVIVRQAGQPRCDEHS